MIDANIKYNKLAALIGKLKGESNAEELARDILDVISKPTFDDIWFDDDEQYCPISYWLYIAEDIHEETESRVIKQILFWREFHGKSIAKVRFVQVSDSFLYNLCIKKFRPKSFPSLLISDNPFFEEFIEINNNTISKIGHSRILGFLNSIHREISTGTSIENLRQHLSLHNPVFDSAYQQVMSLISSGQIEKAFDKIIISVVLAEEHSGRLTLLTNRFNSVKSSRSMISDDEYFKQITKVTYDLIEFVNVLKKGGVM